MENLKRLQALALKLILFLVWFDLMCFALILAGNIFKWSFFNESIGSAFFTMFGLSLGALAALALLHLVVTLNIISNSVGYLITEKEIHQPQVEEKTKKRFMGLLSASMVAIMFIVGYQGVVERNAARHKIEKIKNQLVDVGQSTLARRIIDLIEKDAPINELYLIRDELLLSLQENRSITLLLPRTGEKMQVFYQITPWDYDSEDETVISLSLERLFVPRENERKKFTQLISDNEPFTIVNRHNIRAFYPVTRNDEVKLILLLDTSRTISSDYLTSRGKFK